MATEHYLKAIALRPAYSRAHYNLARIYIATGRAKEALRELRTTLAIDPGHKKALALLREPCMARIQGGKYSSFVVGGRDGLPLEPGGLLPSPIF